MSDRTSLQVFVYACPESEREAMLAVIDQHGGWDEGDSAEGRWTDYEACCGSADTIARALSHDAPGASFLLWEDPAYQWLGSLEAYTPELGSFSGECTSEGTVVARYQDVAGKTAHELSRLYGLAWFDDWQRAS